MRFLVYRLTADAGAGLATERADRYAEVIDDANRAGVLLCAGPVGPSAPGARLTSNGDVVTVAAGPFPDPLDLAPGWALLETRDQDEAIAWARRFQAVVGDGEARIRPAT